MNSDEKSRGGGYFIGLDCGTSSVGWAVSDRNYKLLRAKGKTLWGAHLFDEAETAKDRRAHRSARRRGARAKGRLKLLRLLFEEEISKVDPEFYQRLRESFYWEDDKRHLKNKSKNTLFNDPDFTDKDYHKKYPTIWHLRQALIHAGETEHFDIRLYFLVIQHILKHRGHFLIDGKLGKGGSEFEPLFREFCEVAENFGYRVNDDVGEEIAEVLCARRRGKTDKKNAIKELLFREGEELEENQSQGTTELAGLLVGSKVKLSKVFGVELSKDEDKSYSFEDNNFDEEKLPEIEQVFGTENVELVVVAKKVYDWAILKDLLGEHEFVADAMVANFEQHQKDLAELKKVFRPHAEIYRQLFKEKICKDPQKAPNYNAYISKAYTEDKNGRHKNQLASQADFNREIKKQLETIGYTGELLARAEEGVLLPKQRGQAKGTIPQQLHHNELEKILQRLQKDYPSFALPTAGEDGKYNTKAKKIAKIHDFRIPYYCGPLVSNKRSQFSWADEEIRELVRPWNFKKLVNLEERATTFISRMTNNCTYLIDAPVLPKSSLLYQRYMVLNELNNLRVNGQRIDVELKQRIFRDGYQAGRLSGNVTLNSLAKWLKENGFIGRNDDVSGTSEVKFLPKLSTYNDLVRILGEDFAEKYAEEDLEKAVEMITVLGQEKEMLRRKIRDLLGCDEEVARKLANKNYKDWGKFSGEFLNGIRGHVDGMEMTLIDALWRTGKNLMELLGSEFDFKDAVESYNLPRQPKATKITYQDVKNLYCSPAVKRAVWRALQIVSELSKVLKRPPEKIFLEVTRGEGEKGKYTASRKKDLEAKLKTVKSPEAKELLEELGEKEERELQSKKLFLYFSQMGRCAYTGERIDIESLNNAKLYDIDHIYPRSLTKDDSITRNLVLVKASENRDKTNIYPIKPEIRNRMQKNWQSWQRAGLITKEKYERLTRGTPLTADELGGFIARQLVETSQSVAAVRQLLTRAYPKTKIVLVRAGQVSDFRHHFGYDEKDKDGNIVRKGRPEFVKVRELNDFHHAKDAYLNIVVGNVINSTFTDDPRAYVRRRQEKNGAERPSYSIKTSVIFRDSAEYRTTRERDGKLTTWPKVRGWNFADSIKIISDALKRNDVLWTRMSYVETGPLFNLQLVGKSPKTDGILPIKRSERLNPERYGGYNSVKGAYFALIETNPAQSRKLVQIPIMYADNPQNYLGSKYPQSRVILAPIRLGSFLKINGVPMHLAGRTGERLVFYHSIQPIVSSETIVYLKQLVAVLTKIRISRGEYKIDPEHDRVSKDKNLRVFDELVEKLGGVYMKISQFGNVISKIKNGRDKFAEFDLEMQCKIVGELLNMISAGKKAADFTGFITGATRIGQITIGNDITSPSSASVLLINQSITGLFEEKVDLKTVPPRPLRLPKKRSFTRKK